MEVDEVFERIGEFGPAQVKLFFVLTLPGMWMALHGLVPNFIGTDPGWNCSIGSPTDSGLNCNVVEMAGALPEGCGGLTLITDPADKCVHYERGDCIPHFNTDFTSIVTEWELICSRSSYPNLAQSGFFFGLMVGSWVFGSLSDMYGRKKIYFLAIAGSILMGLGYSLATSYLMYAVFRILFGMFSQALAVVGYSLLLEIMGASKRSMVGMLTQVAFPLGLSLLVLQAYLIRDWRTLSLVVSLIGVGFLPMWRVTPESPRWLLVQGRDEEARDVLARIARGNRTPMVTAKLKKSVGASSEKGGNVSAIDLFRGHTIRRRTLILLVAWFTNCAVYYGLCMNAGSLGGGRYLSLLLSGLVELPGIYIAYHLLKTGRRLSHGGLLILGGLSCVMWALVYWTGMGGESIQILLALLGKSAVSASFAIIYLYSAELFPTEVRSLGLGVSSVGSRFGGIVAPLILLLSSVSLGLPMLVMGGLGVVAGLLTLSLPETLNQPLPETLSELSD